MVQCHEGIIYKTATRKQVFALIAVIFNDLADSPTIAVNERLMNLVLNEYSLGEFKEGCQFLDLCSRK